MTTRRRKTTKVKRRKEATATRRHRSSAAGLNLAGHGPQQALVKGRAEIVEFYALNAVPESVI